MRAVVVKVATSGEVFADGREIPDSELDRILAEVRASGDSVTYYRESPRGEPTEAANLVFQRVMASRVPIRLGHQVPSEWGTLDWVEVERAPRQSRFFMARGQAFLLAYSEGGPEPVTYVGGPLSDEAEARWLGQVDLLVRSDRVMETPPHEPQLAFAPDAMHTPSLHLRVGYGAAHRWSSRYRLDDVPGHIRTFEQDLSRVGHHLVASSDRDAWKNLSAEEVTGLF